MDQLPVTFCEICGTSVPVADLQTGEASRLGPDEKVVGSCCLAGVRSEASASGGGGARRGPGFGLAFLAVLLAAVAGGTLFLDGRLADVARRADRQSGDLRHGLSDLASRLATVEGATAELPDRPAFEKLEQRTFDLRGSLVQTETRIEESIAGVAAQGRTLRDEIRGLREAVDGGSTRSDEVRRRVDSLAADVSALHREFRQALLDVTPEPAAVDAAVDPDLPPLIAQNIPRLRDSDEGTRFEAVDELLQTGDPRVFPYVLGLSDDPDNFVRRLVVEGLSGFREDRAVEALLTAMEDADNLVRFTAYSSIKNLTGQEIAFDPDGDAARRAAGLERWRVWWSSRRGSFF